MAKDKSQAAKFRETARELGCNESEEHFDEALRAVAKHKPKPKRPKEPEGKPK